MKVSYELKQGYIDIWNEESEEWDRYIKVNKKSVVEEEKKIPEKLGECAYVDGEIAYSWSKSEALLKTKINEIIDYLKSKGDE